MENTLYINQNTEVKHTICDVCCPSFHCGVDAWVRDGKIIRVEGTDAHPVNHGHLCANGLAACKYIYSPDRIKTPLKRTGPRGLGEFKSISWDEAIKEISSKLLNIKSQYGSESVIFASGYSKWYRPYLHRLACSFGSPNYMTESSNCMFSTFLNWYVSTGNVMCSADISNCGVFLGWAFNPYYSRFPAAGIVERRKADGMKVIIVDPSITPASLKLADIHLRPRAGTDGAVALGLAYLLIKNNCIDREYIEKYVHGYDQYKEYVSKFTPEYVEALTGVSSEQLVSASQLISSNLPLAINESASPINHHINGFQNYRAIMSLSAILGCFDRKGGQIPIQFTYNYMASGLPSNEDGFIYEHNDNIKAEAIGFDRFPLWSRFIHEAQANDLPRQIDTGSPYPLKALLGFGYNYRIAPDDKATLEQLKRLEFIVNTDLFMTDTCRYCDIVLPACTSFERSELKTYAGGNVMITKPVIAPLYESRPDTEIICDLARRLTPDDKLLCSGYEECMRYLIADYGVTLETLRNAEKPVRIPSIPYVPGTMLKNRLNTKSGKFELYSEAIAQYHHLSPLPEYTAPEEPDEEYPFVLSSSARKPGMLHTRLSHVSWASALHSGPAADIHPDDAASLGIKQDDIIEITSRIGTIRIKANLTYSLSRGTVTVPHGISDMDINSIIPAQFDPYSGFSSFRHACVKIRRAE